LPLNPVSALRILGLTLGGLWLTINLQSAELPETSENERLKSAVIGAIEEHYFKDLDIAELRKKSLSEVFRTLDVDSSLVKTEPKSSDFVRGFEKVKTLKESKLVKNGIGYVRMEYFSRKSAIEFQQAYEGLKKQGANKLILDLRGNQGGVFETAIAFLEYFTPEGNTIAMLARKDKEIVYRSKRSKPLKFPMVVLVDSQTSSSAELVTAGLRDFSAVNVVGTETQGKRTVQRTIPVENLWLTLTVGTIQIL